MAPPARAFAPRPLNNRSGGPQYRPQLQQRNPIANIAAAQRDYARRTPGVLGASNGGFGLTPAAQWGKEFPNRGEMGAEGLPAGTAPLTDAEKANGVATPTNLQSNAVQSLLDAAATKPTVTTGPNGTRAVAGQYGTGTATPGVGQPTAAETAAATTANGISRAPDWQTAITKAHPEIGIAGSEGNKAYISAYGDALKNKGAGQFDPVQLAHDTMGPIYNQRAALAAMDDKGENEEAQTEQAKSEAATQAANLAATKASATAPAPGSLPDLAGRATNAVNNAEENTANSVINAARSAGNFVTGNRTGDVDPASTGVAWNHNTVAPGTGKQIAQQNPPATAAPAQFNYLTNGVDNSGAIPVRAEGVYPYGPYPTGGVLPKTVPVSTSERDPLDASTNSGWVSSFGTDAETAANHAAQGYYNGFMHGNSAPQYSAGATDQQGSTAPASTPLGPQYGQPASGVVSNSANAAPRTDSNSDAE